MGIVQPTKLRANTQYDLYLIAEGLHSKSEIRKLSFKTKPLSYGAVIKLKL